MAVAAPDGMHSTASIKGHPIHPMFVVFPLALFTVGFVCLLGYMASGNGFWFHVAYLAMIVGGCIGLFAAIFGLADVIGLPRGSRAKTVGIYHGACAFVSTVLFIGAGISMRLAWVNPISAQGFSVGLPLVLSGLGFLVLLVAGVLGWQLVGVHHVAVSPVPGHAGPVKLAGRLEDERRPIAPTRTPAHTGAHP